MTDATAGAFIKSIVTNACVEAITKKRSAPKNAKHPPFIHVQNEATMHRNLFVLDLDHFHFFTTQFSI